MRRWIFLIGLIILMSCGLPDESPSRTSSQASTVKVTYNVTGTKGRYVNLTYTNASGGTEQVSKKIPWTETLTVKRGEHLYLSAQADSVATSVTCLIIANDQKVQEASSSGDYVIASCSGLAR